MWLCVGLRSKPSSLSMRSQGDLESSDDFRVSCRQEEIRIGEEIEDRLKVDRQSRINLFRVVIEEMSKREQRGKVMVNSL
jgi:hypothetical protein